MRTLALFTLLLSLAACQPEATSPPEAIPITSVDFASYGSTITADGAVPVQTVVASPGDYVGQEVKVEGTVAEICQMKGCWATLTTEAGTVRLRAPRNADDSDYVFTLPKDIQGRRIVAQGMLEEGLLTESTQRHLAQDAGATASEADTMKLADKPELQLVLAGALVEKS